VRSAVALTATTLGPSLGDSGDTLPAQILTGGQGGGLDAGVIAGSLRALHGDTIALGRDRADDAHARVGDRVPIMLGDGTRTRATVVAIYTRDLALGDALISPDLATGHQTTPLLGTIFIQSDHPAAVARRLQALAPRYPGLRVSGRATLASATDAENEMNRWFGPQFVAEMFGFTSIAVITTLVMIALGRRRELALMRLVGATTRQVRSMARWEAILIIAIGLGIGLAIGAIALLPLSNALNGELPYIPVRPFAAIVGFTVIISLLALGLPTRRALRTRPIEAIGVGE
jgi:putative ABC transport system permease protein